MILITVTGYPDRWVVSSAELDEPRVFATGAKAERSARELAGSANVAGEDAEIIVLLPSGRTAGRILTLAERRRLPLAG